MSGTETKRVDEWASSVVPEPRLIMCVYAETVGGGGGGGGRWWFVCVYGGGGGRSVSQSVSK